MFPTEFPGEFCRGFFGGFFQAFSLEKTGGKNPPENPRQFSNQNLGVSGPKSTLQGSGREEFCKYSEIRKPLEMLPEFFLKFPSRVWLGTLKTL